MKTKKIGELMVLMDTRTMRPFKTSLKELYESYKSHYAYGYDENAIHKNTFTLDMFLFNHPHYQFYYP